MDNYDDEDWDTGIPYNAQVEQKYEPRSEQYNGQQSRNTRGEYQNSDSRNGSYRNDSNSFNTSRSWDNRSRRPRFEGSQRGGGDNRNNSYGNDSNSFESSRTWDNSQRRPRFEGSQRGSGDSTTMKVPTRFVGRIIGRGGSKINELQTESGAKINVTKDTEGDDTIIRISGSADDVTKAKTMINKLTQDNGMSNRSSQDNSVNYRAPQDNRMNYRSPQDNSNSRSPQDTISFAPDNIGDEKNVQKPSVIIDWRQQYEESQKRIKAEFDKLGPIIKNFYIEHLEVQNMTEEEADNFRVQNNNIVVDRTFKTSESKPIPKPCKTFEHAFHNFPEILDEIHAAGFEKPSPIQSQAWPILLSGEDLIGIAQTGTGKTIAFLLPALIHIDGQLQPREERNGPTVIVMAPTRELALQIDKEVRKYRYKGITAVCLYGGGDRKEQVKVVTNGVDIIIATPGRLNDLVAAGHVNLKTITYVVLDEADRMLDMGFEPQIRKVMYSINPSRQTVMTSATWPSGVRRLAQSYMEDPIQVYVGTLDLAATHTVTQTIQIMDDTEECKFDTLVNFVQNMDPEDKIIVFCGKKARADNIASDLALMGVECQILHGDRDQIDREQALLDIVDGTVRILIATDVASRGLDILDITHVINYDFPRNVEEYVHRVGRTGRAGKTGESISYFTRSDWGQAKELITILEEAEQYVPEELHAMAQRFEKKKEMRDSAGGGRGRFKFGGGGGGGGRRW